MIAFGRAADFEKRNVKVVGLSVNGLESHAKWIQDINEWGGKYSPTSVEFPIVRLNSMPTKAISH